MTIKINKKLFKDWRFYGVLFLMIGALVIFGKSSNQNLQPQAAGLIAPSEYYLRPSYGYLKCEQVGCNPVTAPMDIFDIVGFNDKKDFRQVDMNNPRTMTKYTCQDFIGISEECDITLQATNGNIDGARTNQELAYFSLPSGISPPENINAKVLCANDKDVAQQCTFTGTTAGYDNGEFVKIHLGKGEVLYVSFTESIGSFVNAVKVNNKMNFIVSGICFSLIDVNDRSSTSGQRLSTAITGDCLLRDQSYKNAMITFADPIFGLNSQELNWVNLNAPHRVYTYLAGLEPAPFVYGNVQTYNNQFVFCQKATNTLYKIAPITAYGKTYQSVIQDPSGIVGNVKCCEGDQRPNQVCQNNQWITISQAQCDLSIGKFCSEQDWTPYGSLQVRRFGCVNNQCIPEVKTVECNFNEDCGNGKVCQKGFSPFDNKCTGFGTGDICGDNICTNNEYKSGSCLKDCPPPPKIGYCTNCFSWMWNYLNKNNYCTPQPAKKVLGFLPIPTTSQGSYCPLFLLVLLSLLFLLGMVIYKKQKRGRK